MNTHQLARMCFCTASLLVAVVATDVQATSLTAADVAITEDFNDFFGTGFAPNPGLGQLDSDHWRVQGLAEGDGVFGGTHTTGGFASFFHIGEDPSAGINSYAVGVNDFALGMQPYEDSLTPGNITYRLQNNTGVGLDLFTISGKIYSFDNSPFASVLDVLWSVDDVNYTSIAGNPSFVSGGDPSTNNTQWQLINFSATVQTPLVSVGDFIYFQFATNDAAPGQEPTLPPVPNQNPNGPRTLQGERDQLAIDDISVTGSVIPSPTAAVVGLVGMIGLVARRRRNA